MQQHSTTTHVTRTCERCGRSFEKRLSTLRHEAARFCSRTCFQAISVEERFWAKVRKTEMCWFWTAGTDTGGYGRFAVAPGNHVPAHQFAYESVHGPVPDGLILRHTCDTPPCVRPDHLIPGTNQDNVDDMVERQRQPIGSEKTLAKLSESDVESILAADFGVRGTTAVLARHYGVSPTVISGIRNGTRWRHVKPHD